MKITVYGIEWVALIGPSGEIVCILPVVDARKMCLELK